MEQEDRHDSDSCCAVTLERKWNGATIHAECMITGGDNVKLTHLKWWRRTVPAVDSDG